MPRPSTVNRALLLCLGALLSACAPSEQVASTAGVDGGQGAAAEVLVTVNGRPLTRDDLQQAIRRNPLARDRALTAQQERNLLEAMVKEELLAQRAIELGLDGAPRVQQQLRDQEAELAARRRQLLAREARARLAREPATVTDLEVRAYHAAKKEQVESRFHVHQILRRRPGEIEALGERLEAGESFDTLAAEGMTPVPAGATKPWDLGFLRWTQLPEAWRPSLTELEPGEISPIVRAGRRQWILKLVARERDTEASYESLAPALRADLLRRKTAEQREQAEAELRTRAEIDFAPGRTPTP